eukprot:6186520-Pleurochrysis_carterae.AAC.5
MTLALAAHHPPARSTSPEARGRQGSMLSASQTTGSWQGDDNNGRCASRPTYANAVVVVAQASERRAGGGRSPRAR